MNRCVSFLLPFFLRRFSFVSFQLFIGAILPPISVSGCLCVVIGVCSCVWLFRLLLVLLYSVSRFAPQYRTQVKLEQMIVCTSY